jgi:hypothetical protein
MVESLKGKTGSKNGMDYEINKSLDELVSED